MNICNHVPALRDAGLTDDGRWYNFRKRSDERWYHCLIIGYRLPVLPILVLYYIRVDWSDVRIAVSAKPEAPPVRESPMFLALKLFIIAMNDRSIERHILAPDWSARKLSVI